LVRGHPDTQSTERIGSLDGLRGIAILSVIFVHWIVRPNREAIEGVSLRLYDLVEHTVYGVDAFFVVSGFLIGRILIAKSSEMGFLKTFYVRRFLRIIPLYFAVIGFFFIARILIDDYPDTAVPLWSYFAFVNNIIAATGAENIAEYGAYWSLAIEEQFYLSSALLAVVLGRRGVVLLAVFFVVASVATRTAVLLSLIDIGTWQFTLSHADPIGIGLLAAAALNNLKVSEYLRNNAGLIKFAGLSSFAVFLLNGQFTSGELMGLNIFLISISVASWILLKFLVEPMSWLSVRPLRRIGEMSFSLYILHLGWGIYSRLFGNILGISGAAALVIGFVTLLVVCRLLWVYVESPLIALGHTWQYGIDGKRLASPATREI
jgi:peptidoglycan/LPS O-acetylase OafA/YrhL